LKVCLVDLDNDRIRLPSDIPYVPIPSKVASKLMGKIRTHAPFKTKSALRKDFMMLVVLDVPDVTCGRKKKSLRQQEKKKSLRAGYKISKIPGSSKMNFSPP